MDNNKLVIVDNFEELDMIYKLYPELRKTPVILLSCNFSVEKLKEISKQTNYWYFDHFIDEKYTESMKKIIETVLWSWYKDEKGTDLSLINGLSLGKTVAGAMEILFNTILKYEYAFSKLLTGQHEIYFLSTTNDVFLAVIKYLHNKNKFIMHEVKANILWRNKNKSEYDLGGRARNLSIVFKIKVKNIILSYFLRFMRLLKPKNNVECSILLFTAGKLEEFVGDKKRLQNNIKINWILQLCSVTDLINIVLGRSNPNYIFNFYTSYKFCLEISRIISQLEINIKNNVHEINPEILVPVLRRNIFNYFSHLVSYYNNTINELRSLKPRLVIVSANTIEDHLIVAQAAKKLNINTALLPHGIDDCNYAKLMAGENRFIDYGFAFGNKHKMDFLDLGVESERIVVTSYPYFSRFARVILPEKSGKNIRALVLTPDFINMSPLSRYGDFFKYIENVCKMLKEINIDLIGIKSRVNLTRDMYGIKNDYMEIENQKIKFFTGYSMFYDVAKDSDLVIGCISTAIMEAGLMGVDYYVICPENEYNIFSLSQNVKKIMYVADNVSELRDNILKKKIYRENYSVKDFIDVENKFTKESLYDRFETSILNFMQSKVLKNDIKKH